VVGGGGESDDLVLQGLALRLQSVAAELGQLVEEEHAVVGEAHLPWTGMLPPMRPASEMEWWGER